jgi:hypothetical protein
MSTTRASNLINAVGMCVEHHSVLLSHVDIEEPKRDPEGLIRRKERDCCAGRSHPGSRIYDVMAWTKALAHAPSLRRPAGDVFRVSRYSVTRSETVTLHTLL